MRETTMIALGVLLMVVMTWMCIFNYYISPTPEEWRFIHPLIALVFDILVPLEVAKAIRRQRRGEKRVLAPLRQRIIAATIILVIGAILVLFLLFYWHMI